MNVLAGRPGPMPPVMPIVHSALARCAGVPLGEYYTRAEVMAEVIAGGVTRFGFDGVQLSLGVTAEAEALGATVEQPPDGAPLIKHHPFSDLEQLHTLDIDEVAQRGRLPMYHAAVRQVVDAVGDRAFVLSTLRGPLNTASQLLGVENMLIAMLESPEQAGVLLDTAVEITLKVAEASLAAGADGIMLGEATCSPNFISPVLYRQMVHPRHIRLVAGLKRAGWSCVGLHVCGNLLPILEDLIATGVDLLDVDFQVSAVQALTNANHRVVLRGNLDPVGVFLRGSIETVRQSTQQMCAAVRGNRWIAGSGCDIPPGTSADQLVTFLEACRSPVD